MLQDPDGFGGCWQRCRAPNPAPAALQQQQLAAAVRSPNPLPREGSCPSPRRHAQRQLSPFHAPLSSKAPPGPSLVPARCHVPAGWTDTETPRPLSSCARAANAAGRELGCSPSNPNLLSPLSRPPFLPQAETLGGRLLSKRVLAPPSGAQLGSGMLHSKHPRSPRSQCCAGVSQQFSSPPCCAPGPPCLCCCSRRWP